MAADHDSQSRQCSDGTFHAGAGRGEIAERGNSLWTALRMSRASPNGRRLRDVLAKVDAVPTFSPLCRRWPSPSYSYAATMQPPSHLVYAGFWLRFVRHFYRRHHRWNSDGNRRIGWNRRSACMGFSYGMSHPGGKSRAFMAVNGILDVSLSHDRSCRVVNGSISPCRKAAPAQATLGKRVDGY